MEMMTTRNDDIHIDEHDTIVAINFSVELHLIERHFSLPSLIIAYAILHALDFIDTSRVAEPCRFEGHHCSCRPQKLYDVKIRCGQPRRGATTVS